MKYSIDTEGAEENTGGFVLIPEEVYDVMIVEKSDKTTTKGDPMVNVKFEISDGKYKGKPLYDNIVIPNQGSPSFGIMGRTMHFLHVIGQPYQGNFVTDSDKWLFCKLKVKVKHEKQTQGKYAGQMKAVINEHHAIDAADAPGADSDIPF